MSSFHDTQTTLRRPVLPAWYARKRTARERLLAALREADRHGWRLTYQHMAEQLYHLDSGRIKEIAAFAAV